VYLPTSTMFLLLVGDELFVEVKYTLQCIID
jgi:hypothetical protein